jgi:hypothetical protein
MLVTVSLMARQAQHDGLLTDGAGGTPALPGG